ncbi:MAG: hypothetical protein GX207_04795 [Peptococcaceae bacterium]|nr:hypothetical protein [Peptococcaceae bacterium]
MGAIRLNTIYQKRRVSPYTGKIRPAYYEVLQWFKKRLDTFNLCPPSIIFWYPIPPYTALGISVQGLNFIPVYWRQQIEPNETIFLGFKIMELRPPVPLTVLTMFFSIGLVITGSVYKLIEALNTQGSENNPPNPFKQSPRLAVFFPIYDNHTALGILYIDFKIMQFSIKQSLEPNENIVSLIRFLDIVPPFPLQVATMFLALGLFLNWIINEKK